MRRALVVVEHQAESNPLAAAEARLIQRADHCRVGELTAARLAVLFRIRRIERVDIERRLANPQPGAVDAHFDVVHRRLPVAAGLRPPDSELDVFEISHGQGTCNTAGLAAVARAHGFRRFHAWPTRKAHAASKKA
jgi:hypothetical protein